MNIHKLISLLYPVCEFTQVASVRSRHTTKSVTSPVTYNNSNNIERLHANSTIEMFNKTSFTSLHRVFPFPCMRICKTLDVENGPILRIVHFISIRFWSYTIFTLYFNIYKFLCMYSIVINWCEFYITIYLPLSLSLSIYIR